jgi:hypothetical protein
VCAVSDIEEARKLVATDPVIIRGELFAEYPALVVGKTSRFAIHLTRLDSFKALTDGRVEVRLEGGQGPAESFTTDARRGQASSASTCAPRHPGRGRWSSF